MQFNSFNEFIAMGGYGFYVWLSFGSAAVILSLLLIVSKTGHQQTIKKIAKRQAREQKLRQARNTRKKQTDDSTQQDLAKVAE